jgi:hypothetical protein
MLFVGPSRERLGASRRVALASRDRVDTRLRHTEVDNDGGTSVPPRDSSSGQLGFVRPLGWDEHGDTIGQPVCEGISRLEATGIAAIRRDNDLIHRAESIGTDQRASNPREHNGSPDPSRAEAEKDCQCDESATMVLAHAHVGAP